MDEVAQFLREFGLPITVVILLIFEILVPKGRLRREESRGDRAMTIAEAQVAATTELTSAVKEMTAVVRSWTERQTRR